MIETCVNINITLRDTLTQSAKRVGLTRNTLAHLLLCKVMHEKRLAKPKIFIRVRYQSPDPAKEWKNMGIDLTPEMFEKCQDMRKVLKLSVSFILAYAIRTYLDQVIAECLSGSEVKNRRRDNYVQFYSIQCMYDAGVESIIIHWTKKPQKE